MFLENVTHLALSVDGHGSNTQPFTSSIASESKLAYTYAVCLQ